MRRLAQAIGYGLIFSFVIIIAVSFILSFILYFTSVTESSISWIIIAVTFAALFIGGFVAGGKAGESGWMLGGMTGLAYVAIIFMIQFLGFDMMFDLKQVLFHLAYMLTAAFGGIIGVNIIGKNA